MGKTVCSEVASMVQRGRIFLDDCFAGKSGRSPPDGLAGRLHLKCDYFGLLKRAALNVRFVVERTLNIANHALALPCLGLISYIGPVKNLATPILLLACLCLIMMQMSGTHLHVDADGEHAGLHGTHLHETNQHGHDHNAESDVSVLEELGLTWSKLLPIILAGVALLFTQHWPRQQTWLLPVQFGKPRRRSRWRPPLRAPPLPL